MISTLELVINSPMFKGDFLGCFMNMLQIFSDNCYYWRDLTVRPFILGAIG